MFRKMWKIGLSILLVLWLLAGAVQPAMAKTPSPQPVMAKASLPQPMLAEAPPPPSDSPAGSGVQPTPAGGGTQVPDQPEDVKEPSPAEYSAPEPVSAAAPIDFSQWAPPPMVSAGGVGEATRAEFTADGEMLDSSGVLRSQGEILAAVVLPGAIACPLGKVPLIYGGSSNTGCTLYYDQSAFYPNPIQSAIYDPKTKSTWWIWVSQNYINGVVAPTGVDKAVVVAGDPLGTSVAGGFAINYSGVTLRELLIQDGRVTANGLSGTLRLQGVTVKGTFAGQYGIDITGHKGSVYLSNVTSTIATGGGARVDTTGGSGTVTVLNSAFNNNTGLTTDGLYILSKNAVRVENVSAQSNGGDGMYIEYRTRLTLKNITANLNALGGVDVLDMGTTPGPVTLTNITASGNLDWEGIYLENTGSVTGANLVLVNNSADDGMEIWDGRGSVTLRDVVAMGNDYYGMDIEVKGPVTISTADVGGGNGDGGVYIYSEGAVTVKNSIFAGNRYDGLYIENYDAPSLAGVTLTNLDTSENDYYGIYVDSSGAVALSGIVSSGNGCNGAHLETYGTVNVNGTYGVNAFNDNGFADGCSGLYVYSYGSASVSNASAQMNANDGMGLFTAKGVRVTNSIVGGNGEIGLDIGTDGSATVDRVMALHNTLAGIYVDNRGPVAGIPVTLTNNVANYNGLGVEVYSGGAVTVNHLNANSNNGAGVWIDNVNGGSGTGSVTLSNSLGANLISHNGTANLSIISRGSVTLTGVVAGTSQNGYGAQIDNTAGAGNVSISSSSFNTNGNDGDTNDHGLIVLTKGTISLRTVTANDNEGMGANLQNQTATLTGKTISISQGMFSHNKLQGANIGSKSTVTLNSVIANENGNVGLNIDNYQLGAGSGNISISSTLGYNQFNGNGSNGLNLITKGSLTVSKAVVDKNATMGVYLESFGAAKTATFTCVNATNNGLHGISIMVFAGTLKVTLQGVWLGGNTGNGLNYSGTPVIVRATCQ